MSSSVASADGAFAGKNCLVIGGTQFMGRHVVSLLLARGARVTILNRGPTGLHFNEKSSTETGEGVGAARWDGVIDFVCFRRKGMEDIISQAHAIGHYIFISTDSVFMACDRVRVLAYQGVNGLPEEAAIPPQSKEAKKKAKKNNKYQFEYGGGKLDCELCLQEAQADGGGGGGGGSGGIAYTILRLPDVVGPWDNIGSQLRLQEALIAGKTIGTKVGAPCGRVSLVGAADVARAVAAVLSAGERAFGRTLHIACVELPTFEQYVHIVAAALGVGAVTDPREEADLVTVDIGPISSAAARGMLDWAPAALTDTVQETIAWYKDEGNARYTKAFDSSSSSASSSSEADQDMSLEGEETGRGVSRSGGEWGAQVRRDDEAADSASAFRFDFGASG